MLALETSQKPSVSRGHSQPRGPGDIAKEISPLYLAASGAEKCQGSSLEPQTSALAVPEVASTTQHFILASLLSSEPRGQNHVRHFEGKRI